MSKIPWLLLLFLLNCQSPVLLPRIGDELVLPPNSNLMGNDSGESWRFKTFSINGIAYDIASDESHHIARIETKDPNFRTPDGFGVSSTLEQILASGASLPTENPSKPFFSVRLQSGWYATFISKKYRGGAPLDTPQTALLFYQRK